MKEQEINLDEIFNLIKTGNRREGIKLLYTLHYNKLYGIAFLFVKNQTETEDIVHNAIYKLLNLKPELFPETYVSTWLYTFMKNEALTYLRKEKSAVSIDEIIDIGKEDQKIENYVDTDTYYSMIKNLSEEQRQIVTLKVLGGYTHKEIAQMLGKPIGTVQWIYNTSIKKLRYILSSLITSIVIFASVLTVKSAVYFYKLFRYDKNHPGETMKGIPFDFGIIVFAVLLILSIAAFIIFLKKPEKTPTKSERKSV